MKLLFSKKKIIYFLHIYKTGGTTVKDMLHRNYSSLELSDLYYSPWGSSGEEEEFKNLPEKLKITKNTKVVYGHYLYGLHQNIKRPYTYFAFMREPLQRIVSTYYHLKRLDKEWQLRILKGLDSRIQTIETLDMYFPNITTYLSYKGVQNQQCMFLTGAMPNEIDKDQEFYANLAIENIKKDFAFIGLTESFEKSLKLLQDKLNLKTTSYEYQNLGNNKPKSVQISDELQTMFSKNSLADKIIYDFVKETYYS